MSNNLFFRNFLFENKRVINKNNIIKYKNTSSIDYLCCISPDILGKFLGITINIRLAMNYNFNIINVYDFMHNRVINLENLKKFFLHKSNESSRNNILIIDADTINITYRLYSQKNTIYNFLEKNGLYKLYIKSFIHFMDFHDYSMIEITQYNKMDYKSLTISNDICKNKLYNYITNNKLNIISWVYSPEIQDFEKKYKVSIYLSHSFLNYQNEIFKRIPNINKNIDVLSYGAIYPEVYKLRNDIYTYLQDTNITLHRHEYNIHNQHELAKKINSSWITITCTSLFKYFVRKYIEILVCGSLPAGDLTKEGAYFIGYNCIYLDLSMNKNYILKKVQYYLNNKNIISYIVQQGLDKIKNIPYKSLDSLLDINISNTYKVKYNEIELYDYLHIYDNFNNINIINLDNLHNYTNIDKYDLIDKINNIAIIVSDNNDYNTKIDESMKNNIIICCTCLNNILDVLPFVKKVIYISNNNYESDILLLNKYKINHIIS